MRKLVYCILALCLVTGCTRQPLKKREHAMRLATAPPELKDDLPFDDLLQGLRREIEILRAKPKGSYRLTFGARNVSGEEYANALARLVDLAESGADRGTFLSSIRNQFDFYSVYGTNDWGKALITSYYEPEIRGAKRKTSLFAQALYRTPPDLIEVAFPRTDERFADAGQMRGRLASERTLRGTPKLIPFFTREEIDSGLALAKRGLELCWVEPVDGFFLQIQGSGTVLLDDGSSLAVGYADQNGHPYQAVGRYLTDVLPLEKITLHTLEHHLRSLPTAQTRALLNRNPSYVFFEKRKGPPLTANGTPALPGRTIATDARFFPKGTLAFLKFEKPVFKSPTDSEPTGWESAARLVMDQDTGGAIKGGGRADLFWGSGAVAKQSAGVIKQTGELYYLVPK